MASSISPGSLAAARQKQIMSERIAAHPEAERVRREFDALEEAA